MQAAFCAVDSRTTRLVRRRVLAPGGRGRGSLPQPGRWWASNAQSEAKMATNPDFRDLLSALCAADAEFIIGGAHAVMFHTIPRYTKDLDVWVRPTLENAERVHRALRVFGAPMADLTADDLATPGTIFQIGIAPNRVDIITSIDAVIFDEGLAAPRLFDVRRHPHRAVGRRRSSWSTSEPRGGRRIGWTSRCSRSGRPESEGSQ